MKIIGFANKMYTLWNCISEKQYIFINDTPNYIGDKKIYNYVKNISMDLNKVLELYPDLEIDMNLKGTSSFEIDPKDKYEYPTNCFNLGKYIGTTFDNCNDAEYIIYAINKILDQERSKIAIDVLVDKFGYFYEYDETNIFFKTKEEHQKYLSKKKTKIDNEKKLEDLYDSGINGITLEIHFNKNLSMYGSYSDNGAIFFFKDFKTMDYSGHTYGLPLLKGVGKKIKNKTLLLDVITGVDPIFGDKCFNVINFKILK